MTTEEQLQALIERALEGLFDSYETAEKPFFGQPWVYIKAYHNGKAVIFDVSVATLKHYGIIGDSVKKEWCRAWGEW